jgi:hypothetical protein
MYFTYNIISRLWAKVLLRMGGAPVFGRRLWFFIEAWFRPKATEGSRRTQFCLYMKKEGEGHTLGLMGSSKLGKVDLDNACPRMLPNSGGVRAGSPEKKSSS